jgi:exodeoxyribonuclease X
MPEKFLYFDTETTDLQTKDIMQLAFVTDSDISLNLFFKPKQDISVSAMAIHHITPEDVEDLEYFEDTKLPKENIDPEFKGKTLKEYIRFLADRYIWVAHNAEFDVETLKRQGLLIPDPICTLKVARHSLTEKGRDLEHYSLQYLRYYLKLYQNENKNHTTAHDALSDVYFLRDLFHYLQENTKLTAEQMRLISKQPLMIREMSFGKYAGVTLEEIKKIDREYLEWASEAMDDKPELVWNIRRVLDSSN